MTMSEGLCALPVAELLDLFDRVSARHDTVERPVTDPRMQWAPLTSSEQMRAGVMEETAACATLKSAGQNNPSLSRSHEHAP